MQSIHLQLGGLMQPIHLGPLDLMKQIHFQLGGLMQPSHLQLWADPSSRP